MSDRRENNTNKGTYEFINELCGECNTHVIVDCCNKCGEGVCNNDTCSDTYPHYHNTFYVICRKCFHSVNNRLYVLVDNETIPLVHHSHEMIRTISRN